MSGSKVPSQEDIRLIFKDTYLLYKEMCKAKTDEEFLMLIKKSHEIKNNYPFNICETIISEIWNVIDKHSKESEHG